MSSYLMNIVTPYSNFEVVSANGQNLITSIGSEFIDWFMDTGTVSLGYRPIELVSRIAEYAFPHLPNMVTYKKRENVAARLCGRTKMAKVFFCNSGTEAVEAAIKIARKWNYDNNKSRKTIWTAKGGFHGRTYGSLAAGDGAEYHYEGFWPMLEGFRHFEHPSQICLSDCAAIMFAPIFGNNDVREYDEEWMDSVFDKAERHDIPVIFDEIQTGSFRTGCFTAANLYGLEPDIICLGKGIACGVPTGATLVKEKFAEVITPGTHFSTFGGSPLSMIGISTLLDAPELAQNVLVRETQIRNGLDCLRRFGVKDIRGRGLMIAIEFKEGCDAAVYSEELLKQGMFVPVFRKNIMKLAPPLNMSYSDVEQGLKVMERAFAQAFARLTNDESLDKWIKNCGGSDVSSV